MKLKVSYRWIGYFIALLAYFASILIAAFTLDALREVDTLPHIDDSTYEYNTNL